jgi:hypothetical protein
MRLVKVLIPFVGVRIRVFSCRKNEAVYPQGEAMSRLFTGFPVVFTTLSAIQTYPPYSRRAFSFSARIVQALAKAAFLPCLEMETEVFPCFPWWVTQLTS